jgi:hypothetical protein
MYRTVYRNEVCRQYLFKNSSTRSVLYYDTQIAWVMSHDNVYVKWRNDLESEVNLNHEQSY